MPTFSRKMPPKNKLINSGSPKTAFSPGKKRVHMQNKEKETKTEKRKRIQDKYKKEARNTT